jgi:hypothetical protein
MCDQIVRKRVAPAGAALTLAHDSLHLGGADG